MIKFCLSIFIFFVSFYTPCVYAQSVDTELNQIPSLNKPECESSKLLEKVIFRIQEYIDSSGAQSAISRRKNALVKTNVKGFESKDVKTFTHNEDIQTANALISLKINKQLSNDDITLCKQSGKTKPSLYLIMYPNENVYTAHIINLDQYSDDYERISFTYP